jgi:hypothetical protein
MGYSHIRADHAERIQQFYREHFNPYLNFHRPCAQPDIQVDDRRDVPLVSKNRGYKNLLNDPSSRHNSAFYRRLSSCNILAKLFLAGWRKCDGRGNYVRGENPAFRLG